MNPAGRRLPRIAETTIAILKAFDAGRRREPPVNIPGSRSPITCPTRHPEHVCPECRECRECSAHWTECPTVR